MNLLGSNGAFHEIVSCIVLLVWLTDQTVDQQLNTEK